MFVSVALGDTTGNLDFTTGPGQKPRACTVTAREPKRVLDAIAQAPRRVGLPETAPGGRGDAAGHAGVGLPRF